MPKSDAIPIWDLRRLTMGFLAGDKGTPLPALPGEAAGSAVCSPIVFDSAIC
jgi:hypothetical protein